MFLRRWTSDKSSPCPAAAPSGPGTEETLAMFIRRSGLDAVERVEVAEVALLRDSVPWATAGVVRMRTFDRVLAPGAAACRVRLRTNPHPGVPSSAVYPRFWGVFCLSAAAPRTRRSSMRGATRSER